MLCNMISLDRSRQLIEFCCRLPWHACNPAHTHTHTLRACHFGWGGSNVRAGNLAFFNGHHQRPRSRHHHHFILDKYKTLCACVWTDRVRIAVWSLPWDRCSLLEQVTFLLARVRLPCTLCKDKSADFAWHTFHTMIIIIMFFLFVCFFLIGHLNDDPWATCACSLPARPSRQ